MERRGGVRRGVGAKTWQRALPDTGLARVRRSRPAIPGGSHPNNQNDAPDPCGHFAVLETEPAPSAIVCDRTQEQQKRTARTVRFQRYPVCLHQTRSRGDTAHLVLAPKALAHAAHFARSRCSLRSRTPLASLAHAARFARAHRSLRSLTMVSASEPSFRPLLSPKSVSLSTLNSVMRQFSSFRSRCMMGFGRS